MQSTGQIERIVPISPLAFEILPPFTKYVRSVVKSGDKYTLTVDYVDELPEWMPKSVAKTVEYSLNENENGSFRISSMRIISVKTSDL